MSLDTLIGTEFQTETVRLADLRPHPRNYRQHPEDQLEHLVQSIREHGVYRNVVVADDLTILAGHGVVQAAKLAGLDEIPVKRQPYGPEDIKALKLLVADNEIEHLADQDDRKLSELLKSVKDDDPDGLLGTGYDEMMLAGLVMTTRPASEIRDMDEAAEWVGMPEYDPGEPALKVVVTLSSQEDRGRFMELIGCPAPRMTNPQGTWSVVWPARGRDDLSSVTFMEAGDPDPDE